MPVTLNALYPGVLPRRHALSSRWMRAVDHNTCENRLEEVQEADTSSLFPLSLFQDVAVFTALQRATLHASETWPLTKPSLQHLQRNDRAMIKQICNVKP